jgi:uncharacterized protein YlxW (UPF0749 family)
LSEVHTHLGFFLNQRITIVKEQNPDEFQELHDILSRYQTLKASNERLQENQKRFTEEIDTLNRQIASYTKEMNTQKMTLNNKIATK